MWNIYIIVLLVPPDDDVLTVLIILVGKGWSWIAFEGLGLIVRHIIWSSSPAYNDLGHRLITSGIVRDIVLCFWSASQQYERPVMHGVYRRQVAAWKTRRAFGPV